MNQHNFIFKPVNEVDSNWLRRMPEQLFSRFKNANTDSEFIDDDSWVDTSIQSESFIPENKESINPIYYQIISSVSQYFETIAMWELVLHSVNNDPIKSFTIIGYQGDVKKVLNVLHYIIDNLNAYRIYTTRAFRNSKKKLRNKGSSFNKKHSRTRANAKFKVSIAVLDSFCESYLQDRDFSVLHKMKVENIEKCLMNFRTLYFKNYSYKRLHIIKDAYCRKGHIIIGRIIK